MTFKFLIYIWNFFVFRWRCWSCVEGQVLRWVRYSTFSHSHKIGNNCINGNFVLPYNCSFLYYLHHMMLVNVKLDVSWYEGLPFKLADFSILNGQNEVGRVVEKVQNNHPARQVLSGSVVWGMFLSVCLPDGGRGANLLFSEIFFSENCMKTKKIELSIGRIQNFTMQIRHWK